MYRRCFSDFIMNLWVHLLDKSKFALSPRSIVFLFFAHEKKRKKRRMCGGMNILVRNGYRESLESHCPVIWFDLHSSRRSSSSSSARLLLLVDGTSVIIKNSKQEEEGHIFINTCGPEWKSLYSLHTTAVCSRRHNGIFVSFFLFLKQ